MAAEDAVIERMQAYIDQWAQADDKRAVFLSCYALDDAQYARCAEPRRIP